MKRADAETLIRVRAFILRRGMRSQEAEGQVFAYVNHGRWVANCPCGGAELVVEGQPLECGSCALKREVVWPVNADVIESMLEQRQEVNQNWNVGETVDQLESEVR